MGIAPARHSARLLVLMALLAATATATESVERTLADLAAKLAKEQEQYEQAVGKAKGEAIKALETTARRAMRNGDTAIVAEAWKETLRLDMNHEEARKFFTAVGQLDAVLKDLDDAANSDLLGNPVAGGRPLAQLLATGSGTRRIGHAALAQAAWETPRSGAFAIAKTPGKELQLSGAGTFDTDGKIAILPADLGTNWQISGEILHSGSPTAGFVVGFDPAKGTGMMWYSESDSAGTVYTFQGINRQRIAETSLGWPKDAWMPFSVIRRDNQVQITIKGAKYVLTLTPGYNGERFGVMSFFKEAVVQLRGLTLVVTPGTAAAPR